MKYIVDVSNVVVNSYGNPKIVGDDIANALKATFGVLCDVREVDPGSDLGMQLEGTL